MVPSAGAAKRGSRPLRRSRSIAQFGRKTYNTRCIGHLQIPCRRLRTAAAQQFDPPARSADPRLAIGRGGQRRDAPAGHRSARPRPLGGGLRAGTPAPQDQRGDARTLGGKLQPAPGDHRQPANLADDGGNSRHAQSFFERPENVVVACRPDADDPRRVKPVRGKARPVKIAVFEAPQDDAAQPPSLFLQGINRRTNSTDNACGKSGGDRSIFLIGTLPVNLMQRTECKPAARQSAVDRGEAERQEPAAQYTTLLDPANALLQIDKGGGR